MNFDELLKLVRSPGRPRLCDDSRRVAAGDIFVAVKGPNVDGHDFIPQVIANGAKYIVCQNQYISHESRETSHVVIPVPDSSLALASLAQAYNDDPASKLTNLAVTGTNGKTTVTFLVRSCFQAAGEKCGLIGTVIYDTGLGVVNAELTTPDCLTIAQAQAQMLKAGAKFMVIEASSHALDQNRLAAVGFKVAAFTNLTGDHLDYHKTTENYLAAKSKLFSTLSPDAIAVLNKQSPYAQQIAQCTKAKILFYAVDEPADLSAHINSIDITGTNFTLRCQGQNLTIQTPLLGRYNVANHLAAAGLCLAAGLNLNAIAQGLSSLAAIPGRLEKIPSQSGFTVLVDFAHTDDALNNVLSTLKPLCKARLIVVFGCGGDRDKTKRPRMAKVVERFADLAIVTSDNPRTENPNDIINEIVAGFEKGTCIRGNQLRDTSDERRATKIVEPDRKKAIALAIKSAGTGDVVLIAGKGHENYQIIGKQKFPFSDKTIALNLLQNKYG
ncbi:MAG: UDP-N-acetylmuramoyl-L-alanyl-D-glutamate--2,6-diaminopimelate ligase [Sedimentisphaerales bacterium]|jgi:UDP-N-acetylmuramoyl-L-alanyl-D-glutamate--2,6-diaminopimelate ligase